MNFPPLPHYLMHRPLLLAMILGAQAAAAQMPLPDGAGRHPSDYLYPLRTWDQYPPQVRTQRGRVRVPPAIRDRATSYTNLTHKLQSIVIPRIEFHRTSVATAVDFLRRESQRYDLDPNPETRGVNIFLRLPKPLSATSTATEPAPADPNVQLTFTVERLPLLEALKYVASQAGMKIAVEPYAVSLVPLNYVIQNLVTAEYGVPPELLGREADPGDFCSRVNLEAWFEAKGVGFPDGASAIYLTSTQILIVRNTQENLDKIVSVTSSALKTPAPIPANP